MRLGQIGDQISAAVIGHNDLAKLRWQFGCFRDNPHARLGSVRAGHDAPDIGSTRRNLTIACLTCHSPQSRPFRSARDREHGRKHTGGQKGHRENPQNLRIHYNTPYDERPG